LQSSRYSMFRGLLFDAFTSLHVCSSRCARREGSNNKSEGHVSSSSPASVEHRTARRQRCCWICQTTRGCWTAAAPTPAAPEHRGRLDLQRRPRRYRRLQQAQIHDCLSQSRRFKTDHATQSKGTAQYKGQQPYNVVGKHALSIRLDTHSHAAHVPLRVVASITGRLDPRISGAFMMHHCVKWA
jgi:hypothetical protein